MKNNNNTKIAIAIGLIFMSVILVFPIYNIILISFTPYEQIFSDIPRLFLPKLTFRWYKEVFVTTPIIRNIINSFIVATGVVIVNIIVATLGGYSLSRFKYTGKRFFSTMIIFTYLFPPILLVLSLFMIINSLGLTNTYAGIICVHITGTLPFSIWLLRGFFNSIPKELDESALIDGASRLTILLKVIVPIALPGIAAIAAFSFIMSWNEYLFSSVLMATPTMKTLPVKIAEFIVETSEIRWGTVMAAATIALIPATVFFQFIQKAFIEGLTTGAVKG